MISLAADNAAGSPRRGPRVSGRDPIEHLVLTVWRQLLLVPQGSLDDDFFDSGGDSQIAIRMVAELEVNLGFKVPVSLLFTSPTPERLASAIRKRRIGYAPQRFSSLVPIAPAGELEPLFLVHGAGGLVFFACELGRELANRPLYGFQSAGLYASEPPLTTVEEMAARFVAELGESEHQPPYLLAGYSLGGMIAFEMAKQLTDEGVEVAHLLLLDALFPGQASDADSDPVRFAYDFTLEPLPGTPSFEDFAGLDVGERVDSILYWWKFFDRLPAEAGREFVEAYLAVTRANLAAQEMYRADLPYHGRATLLRIDDGLSDTSVDPWIALLPCLHVLLAPGGHFDMFAPPHVRGLAALVEKALLRHVDVP